MGSSFNKVSSLAEKLLQIEESLLNVEISLWGFMGLEICKKKDFSLRFDGKEQDIVRRRWFVSKGTAALQINKTVGTKLF